MAGVQSPIGRTWNRNLDRISDRTRRYHPRKGPGTKDNNYLPSYYVVIGKYEPLQFSECTDIKNVIDKNRSNLCILFDFKHSGRVFSISQQGASMFLCCFFVLFCFLKFL